MARQPDSPKSTAPTLKPLSSGEWEQVFGVIRDSVMVLSADLRIEYANPAAGRMAGCKPAELIGRHCYTVYDCAHGDQSDCPHGRLLAGGTAEGCSQDMEVGGRHYEVSVSPVRDAEGRLLKSLHVAKDITDQKRAVDALRRSEARFRVLFEESMDGLLVVDVTAQRFLVGNPRICEMLGCPAEEIPTLAIPDIHPPEDLPLVLDTFERQRRGEFSLAREIPVRRKNGTVFYADINTAFFSLDEHPYVIGSFRDVTAERAARQRLAESEALNRHILETMQDAVAVLDPEGHLHYANPAFCAQYGYDLETLRRMSPHDLVSTESHPALERFLQEMATQGHCHAQTVDQRRDGSTFLTDVRGTQIEIDGRPCILAVIRDVTRQRQFERSVETLISGAAAQAGPTFFEPMVLQLCQGLRADYALIGEIESERPGWVQIRALAGHGKILDPFAFDMTGTPCGEVLGHKPCSFPANVAQHFPRNHRLASLGVEGYVGVPLFDSHEQPLGIVATLYDRPVRDTALAESLLLVFAHRISSEIERARALAEVEHLNEELEERVRQRTAELEAANRELEAFAYSVSHDLRTPLRALDGYSAILLDDHADRLDGEARGYLGRIRGASQRMGELIEGLLQLSRVTREPLHYHEVDLSTLIREAAAALEDAEPEHRVDWRIAADIHVQGDATLLRVACQNLVENAWKFTYRQAQPVIAFTVERGAGGRHFTLRDNGVGFDPAYADRLFEAFQRLHGERDFPGTGIGLATVRRIVERHGGRIWAEGTPGAGAAFTFTLGPERA